MMPYDSNGTYIARPSANTTNIHAIHYIVFTGPSLSGKTTAAAYLFTALASHKYTIFRDSFEAPLRNYLALLLARKLTQMPWDTPIQQLLNRTPRDFALREQQHMRMSYGPDVLGRLLLTRSQKWLPHPRFIIVDDGTSIQDIRALPSVSLVRINRSNVERVYPFTIPNPDYVLSNKGSLDDLFDNVRNMAVTIGAKL